VIRRARKVLENLEGGELDARGRPRLAADAGDPEPAAQLGLFSERPRDPREQHVLDALRALRTEETTAARGACGAGALAGGAARRGGAVVNRRSASPARHARGPARRIDRPPSLFDVKEVRHWSYPDYTRVVIELDRAR
jgi:hypothetical protein